MMGFGIDKVTFGIDCTPLHRILIRMGIAVWRVVIYLTNKLSLGDVGFRRKKLCAFQRSSEHIVIRRIARLSRIGARSMFRARGTQRLPHRIFGAPSGPKGRPATRRRFLPADFHRRPPVWAARSSYRRRPGLSWSKVNIMHYQR